MAIRQIFGPDSDSYKNPSKKKGGFRSGFRIRPCISVKRTTSIQEHRCWLRNTIRSSRSPGRVTARKLAHSTHRALRLRVHGGRVMCLRGVSRHTAKPSSTVVTACFLRGGKVSSIIGEAEMAPKRWSGDDIEHSAIVIAQQRAAQPRR